MRKIKEPLLFITILCILFVLCLVVSGSSADAISGSPSIVGLVNYIRLFLNDKAFGKALLNAVLKPTIAGVLSVSVFAWIVFRGRQKLKAPRRVFYLGSVFVGGITALIYNACISIANFGASSDVYAAQTTVSPIGDYSPTVFDAITLPNVLLSLFIGVLTAFIFSVLELIAILIKSLRRERGWNEQGHFD